MFPNDPNQNGGQQPQAPQPVYSDTPVQNPSGQYEVVPPLPVNVNNGHTGHNAYEFIMAPPAPKHKLSLGTSKSFLLRIALIVGSAVVLMIIAAFALSAFAPKGATPGLTAIAARQQEIIRIATAATDQTTGQDTANFVANVTASLTSSQQQVINYLAERGTTLGQKTLAADQDSSTDTLLANAASANTYDSAVAQTLTSQLQTYTDLLRTTYHQTSNKQTQALLQTGYSGAALLLTQAKALSADNSN